MPASATCSITVGFAPTATGVRRATLSVAGPPPVETQAVALAGTGVQRPSGISWGSSLKAGPAYTWNTGGALARTVQSGIQRLHLAYATDRIGSSWAKDAGPYAGVYYTRSTSGSTWSTPKRLNPTSQHSVRSSLAAAGSRVYAAWVSQTRIIRYSATAARVLYVRVNTSHGSSTSWKPAIRLTSTSGRVDLPTIAASGYDVHVAWTDSVSGAIKVATSRDRGVTWKTTSLGTTTAATKSGRTGEPGVAVSGSTVAVTWMADPAGTIKGRVSTDRGVHWGPVVTIGTVSNGSAAVAVRGSRIAVAWATGDDLVVRQRLAGVWQEPIVVASRAAGDFPLLYGPSIVLQDPQRIGVAWSEETGQGDYWANLRWTESADGGASWFLPQTLATTSSSSRRTNDWASIQWPAAGTRYVAWNGWTFGTINYRQYLRKGSGTAAGPTTLAAAWNPPEASGGGSRDRANRASRLDVWEGGSTR